MPIVRVEMSPGRTPQQKADLARAMTDAMFDIAKTSAREDVHVIIIETSPDNWAIGGDFLSERRKAKQS